MKVPPPLIARISTKVTTVTSRASVLPELSIQHAYVQARTLCFTASARHQGKFPELVHRGDGSLF